MQFDASVEPVRIVPNRPRAVFDCVIFLSSLSFQPRAMAALAAVESGHIELLISGVILLEIKDVLSRPKIRNRFPHLPDERITAFLARISNLAITVEDVPSVFHYERDPDDEPYLNLAIAAKADFLVTRDHDLLDLGSESEPEGRRLRAWAPQLRILDPAALLKSLAAEIESPQ